ncbi:hypothetical protein GCM10027348_06630 [Hymenobacter tenuis]
MAWRLWCCILSGHEKPVAADFVECAGRFVQLVQPSALRFPAKTDSAHSARAGCGNSTRSSFAKGWYANSAS